MLPTLTIALLLSACSSEPEEGTSNPDSSSADTSSVACENIGDDPSDTSDTTTEYFEPVNWGMYWLIALDEDDSFTVWSDDGETYNSVIFLYLYDTEWVEDADDEDDHRCLIGFNVMEAEVVEGSFVEANGLWKGWWFPEDAYYGATDTCARMDPAKFGEGGTEWVGTHTWGFGIGPIEETSSDFQEAVDEAGYNNPLYVAAGYIYNEVLLGAESAAQPLNAVAAFEIDPKTGEPLDRRLELGGKDLIPAGYHIATPIVKVDLP